MEVFGILGFTIGGSAMTFAIIAWSQIASVKKELDELKKSLETSGVLKTQK